MNYYLGLDLSLTGTGIIVLASNGSVVHSETLKNSLTGNARLCYIRDKIKDVLEDCVPSKVCIENYAMGISTGQSFSIGELGGIVRVLLFEQGYEYTLVSPTQLKKFITGKGVAEKDVIMLSVYKNFGYEPKDNNVADAFGLAKIAAVLAENNTEGLMAYQKEIIEKLLNPDAVPVKKPKKSKKPLIAFTRPNSGFKRRGSDAE